MPKNTIPGKSRYEIDRESAEAKAKASAEAKKKAIADAKNPDSKKAKDGATNQYVIQHCHKDCITVFGNHRRDQCPKCFNCFRAHGIIVPFDRCNNCHIQECEMHDAPHDHNGHLCLKCGGTTHCKSMCRKKQTDLYCHFCYQLGQMYQGHSDIQCRNKKKVEKAKADAKNPEKEIAKVDEQPSVVKIEIPKPHSVINAVVAAPVADDDDDDVADEAENDDEFDDGDILARIAADKQKLREENAKDRSASAPAASAAPIASNSHQELKHEELLPDEHQQTAHMPPPYLYNHQMYTPMQQYNHSVPVFIPYHMVPHVMQALYGQQQYTGY
jgi:hypothetical protein